MSVMTPRLRTLIDHASRLAETDAVLLRRFADTRDPQAFAELVRRYGRLVWGQCRHLLGSEADADDAFQATFLTLANAARTLRDTNKLGPWLHGIAYRVCQQVKRTAARRTRREKAGAKAESTRPVPDSAWDQAFAAVHDELAKLPDTMRVPFVLCVLEGKGTTEAATQLGLKVGTLSSRLSRAKQTILDRLSARGLTAGLAAVGAVAVGASNAPAGVIGKACDLAAGGAVPANILSLSHGVLNMVTMSAKRWTMAVLVGCGLVAGGAGVWQANAQTPVAPPPGNTEPKKDVAADLAKQIDELVKKQQPEDAEKAKRLDQERLYLKEIEAAYRLLEEAAKQEPGAKTKQPEFKYAWLDSDSGLTTGDFEKQVNAGETDGYTFVGVVNLGGRVIINPKLTTPALVFRKKASEPKTTEALLRSYTRERAVEADKTADAKALQEKTLQAEIDRLTRELADLKAMKATNEKRPRTMILLAAIGGDFDSGTALLTGLVRAKFGAAAAGKLQFEKADIAVAVSGATEEQLKWLGDTVKALDGNTPKATPK